ncbi:uncharacterized protein LOC128860676 [Anastrepha ludens]|uniref:uncharacterized protein LOC128860676 n=1 Tax=Anastrepha ludens TaxID=28586 RepID=UPI0023B0DC22|nr:uncharacterized protein LOC128860676 [Anastrepha ludens]
MVTFLQRRCQAMENVAHAMVTKTPSTQTAQKICAVCNKYDHVVYSCPVFASISPNERWKKAKNAKLCINCLKPGHQVQQCKSSACRRCSLMHHTLLHFNQTDQTNLRPPEGLPSPAQSAPLIAMTASNSSPAHPTANSNECVLLATVVVLIRNYVGSLVPCRAILDSASQLNFVTTRLASQLQLKKSKSLVTVSGIGDSELVIDSSVNIFIQSLHSNFTATIDAAVTPTIIDCQPNYSLDITHWDIPANITLADPEFHKPQRVDLLIGASMFFDLLCIGQFHLRNNNHILQKTRFGWVVSGGRGISSRLSSYITTATNSFESDAVHQTTNDMVRSLWEVENSFEPIRKATKEEIDCEAHFKAHYSRMATGEYWVRLPLKPSVHQLGDSYQQALRRFLALERRLQRNHEVKAQYSLFMKEYIELNHMSPILKLPTTVPVYFMPHHCVFKNDSSTTKLRVVFDGSALTTTGYSLNEVLMTGPTIQAKLVDTLIRFRSHSVALSGDICKMYRCIKVAAPDNYLQCILWRDDPQDDIQMFKLDTVTYGTKSAPYLAVRTMHQLAQIILRDFYVDDLITGGDTINDVTHIMLQTSELLGKEKRSHYITLLKVQGCTTEINYSSQAGVMCSYAFGASSPCH